MENTHIAARKKLSKVGCYGNKFQESPNLQVGNTI